MGEGVCLVRDMFIANSMEEAREKAGEQMVNYIKWVCHWRGLGNHMNPNEELPYTENKLDLLKPNTKTSYPANLIKLEDCINDAGSLLLEIGFLMKHTYKAKMTKIKQLLLV